jgi:hypothetical protein
MVVEQLTQKRLVAVLARLRYELARRLVLGPEALAFAGHAQLPVTARRALGRRELASHR